MTHPGSAVRARHGRKRQGGLTLIEPLVVIVLIGIPAATALPEFADLGGDARAATL